MPKLIRLIERFTAVTGHTIRWLSLLMVILVCMVVFMRYFLGMPSVVLQESVQYLHAILFMLGIAYTWQKGAHVRVDVLSKRWSVARKNRVGQLGIVFLVMPLCVFLFIMSWRYVGNSWAILERSDETGGLPFVYLLKTLILIMPVLILLQAVAEFVKTLVPVENTETQHD
ncbi:MAG TPA: TRAP transporter small permease subunit [Pseudomonadales bacterium]|nr:TRAP transporter small permease subunit [Pseudomonadales bacterium]